MNHETPGSQFPPPPPPPPPSTVPRLLNKNHPPRFICPLLPFPLYPPISQSALSYLPHTHLLTRPPPNPIPRPLSIVFTPSSDLILPRCDLINRSSLLCSHSSSSFSPYSNRLQPASPIFNVHATMTTSAST
ncbi:unnamed protein product [Chondrus crispus]|uniref:Uncharacterized protein n=1 Tax=Chondrus crispus TaxID=2769 RepID=R7QE62_CHOCR|nr:unnamed protein product [Chondrus crispus]CDF36369.1 unnamed protein product [Chondrus crispus]|eukprot:XP_005716188.1 unnamed protein product [Chondrus crispus]